ncbi:SDR family NAD(P)-dependent oxidoreductase [Streptomyces sp. NPDC002577]
MSEGRARLAGRSAVVTGAGSGVGRATALRLVREGARVVCADIRDEWAQHTAELAAKEGGEAVAVRCDVAVEAQVEAAIGRAVAAFGRLDIMVNNVGVTRRPGLALHETTEQDWEVLATVNFSGVFYGCKHAVLQFKRQTESGTGSGGVIVNTGSVAGMVGWGGTVYGASKAAVNHITKGVAIEYAPLGIRCNAIAPAAMPLTNFGVADATTPERALTDEQLAEAGAYHPLGRHIEAEDCAAAIAFLASDEAKNITGVLLPIDGGYTAR